MDESPPVDWLLFCLQCKAWKKESDVKVLRVIKNGEDVLVFKCPECREEQMALRVHPAAVGEVRT